MTFRLLDLHLDGKARQFIDARLAAGASLADVTFDIYDATGGPEGGMRVSGVTVAEWRRRPWWEHQ